MPAHTSPAPPAPMPTGIASARHGSTSPPPPRWPRARARSTRQRRYCKRASIPTGQVYFGYDEAGRLLGEDDHPNVNLLTEQVWLGDIPVAVMKRSAQEVIVDNNNSAGTSAVGDWQTTTGGQAGIYGATYRWHAPGAGSDTFTWTPTIPGSGTQSFKLYARWVVASENASNARSRSLSNCWRFRIRPWHVRAQLVGDLP